MGVTLRRNSYPVKTNPLYSFNPNSGYFGKHEDGNKPKTRLIYTDNDPIEETKMIFNLLTKGAKINEDVPNQMWHANLEDGSTVTMRINHPTPEHAPAVMISIRRSNNNAGIKTQKIHFIKKVIKNGKFKSSDFKKRNRIIKESHRSRIHFNETRQIEWQGHRF